MSQIVRSQGKIGFGAGVTWGTAVNATNLIHGTLTAQVNEGQFDRRGVGYGTMRSDVTHLEQTVDVTLTSDLIYNGGIQYPLAYFFGTDTKSLLNAHDYQHILKLDDENDGLFQTLAWLVENDETNEIPSVKYNGVTITHDANTVGQVVMTGIGDALIVNAATPQNTQSEINALTYVSSALEDAVLGGTNHYCRINAYGDGALDSSDNIQILGYTLTLSRPHERSFLLRGASTKYTVEPRHNAAYVIGTLEVRFDAIDSSIIDLQNIWRTKAKQKIEIFFDGSQIAGSGSNANASYKIAIPYAEPASAPTGYDYPDNAGRMQPTMTFNLLAPAAAPTGMTGNTDYAWLTIVNDNSATLV